MIKQLKKKALLTNEGRALDGMTKIQLTFIQLNMNLNGIKEFVISQELHPPILPRIDLISLLRELDSTFSIKQILLLNDIYKNIPIKNYFSK